MLSRISIYNCKHCGDDHVDGRDNGMKVSKSGRQSWGDSRPLLYKYESPVYSYGSDIINGTAREICNTHFCICPETKGMINVLNGDVYQIRRVDGFADGLNAEQGG